MIKGIFLFVDHSRTQSEWQYFLAKKYWFLPINLIKAGGREEGGGVGWRVYITPTMVFPKMSFLE